MNIVNVLSISGANLCIDMKEGEAQEYAIDRLLDILHKNGIRLTEWTDIDIENRVEYSCSDCKYAPYAMCSFGEELCHEKGV